MFNCYLINLSLLHGELINPDQVKIWKAVLYYGYHILKNSFNGFFVSLSFFNTEDIFYGITRYNGK